MRARADGRATPQRNAAQHARYTARRNTARHNTTQHIKPNASQAARHAQLCCGQSSSCSSVKPKRRSMSCATRPGRLTTHTGTCAHMREPALCSTARQAGDCQPRRSPRRPHSTPKSHIVAEARDASARPKHGRTYAGLGRINQTSVEQAHGRTTIRAISACTNSPEFGRDQPNRGTPQLDPNPNALEPANMSRRPPAEVWDVLLLIGLRWNRRLTSNVRRCARRSCELTSAAKGVRRSKDTRAGVPPITHRAHAEDLSTCMRRGVSPHQSCARLIIQHGLQ